MELVEGSQKVEDIFGEWPSFHDAEVLEVTLDREARDAVRGPTIRFTVHAFQMTEEVDSLLGEHVELIALGRRFLEAVRAAAEETFVLREDLLGRGRDYLALLERHMDIEEGRLFPRAARDLNDEDWAWLKERIEQRRDPLFGPALDEDYRRLWRRIQAHRRDDADEQPEQTHP